MASFCIRSSIVRIPAVLLILCIGHIESSIGTWCLWLVVILIKQDFCKMLTRAQSWSGKSDLLKVLGSSEVNQIPQIRDILKQSIKQSIQEHHSVYVQNDLLHEITRPIIRMYYQRRRKDRCLMALLGADNNAVQQWRVTTNLPRGRNHRRWWLWKLQSKSLWIYSATICYIHIE